MAANPSPEIDWGAPIATPLRSLAMPSPFPGIDPYIEARGRWADFRARFLTYVCDELSARLPEHYVAQMEEQVRLARPIDGPGPMVRPDAAILRGDGPRGAAAPADRGLALLEPVSVELEIEYVEEPPHTWVEVR